MLQIPCPFCGVRDDAEFRYRGDARAERPPASAEASRFAAYVYMRENPKGWHLEYWQHAHGCRRVLAVWRHTETHAIAWVGYADAPPPVPPDGGAP